MTALSIVTYITHPYLGYFSLYKIKGTLFMACWHSKISLKSLIFYMLSFTDVISYFSNLKAYFCLSLDWLGSGCFKCMHKKIQQQLRLESQLFSSCFAHILSRCSHLLMEVSEPSCAIDEEVHRTPMLQKTPRTRVGLASGGDLNSWDRKNKFVVINSKCS